MVENYLECTRCGKKHQYTDRVSLPVLEHIEQSKQYFKKHREPLNSGDRTKIRNLEEEVESKKILNVSVCPFCGYWAYLSL